MKTTLDKIRSYKPCADGWYKLLTFLNKTGPDDEPLDLKWLLCVNFKGGNMATDLALQKAAQAWCKETTSHKVMDAELAEAFAEILDEIWSQPRLGNATTGEMLEELKTRAEIHGYSGYRTVDA